MAGPLDFLVIDLFCGAGGLSLGAARAGFSVGAAVDNDAHMLATHKVNFPETTHLATSVADLTGPRLNDLLGVRDHRLAGVIGGPPCQGFSLIGRRDKNDARNELFVHLFRLVAETRPKFFLAENVPGILRSENKEILSRAFSYVERDYQLVPPMSLAASDYGSPTSRKRVFFVGYLAEEVERLTVDSFEPPTNSERVPVRDALRGLPAKINPNWRDERQSWQVVHVHGTGPFRDRLHGFVPNSVGNRVALERLNSESRASGFLATVHTPEVARRYAAVEQGKSDAISKAQRLDPNGYCPTLRAGTGPDKGSYQAVRPLHPTENRVITPREAARLQGFPDWFQFSPTKWHSFREIGSSVSPIIAERILSVVARAAGVTEPNWGGADDQPPCAEPEV